MDNNFDELRQIISELALSQKETDQIVKRTQKQLGELGNKLGSFAEGLAYPTVERIMREKFGMEGVNPIHIRRKDGELEVDALGYSNGNINTVMVGEIKSHFREHHVEKVEQACQRLFDFMPEHRGKKVYGMVIFVKGEQNAIQLAAKHGIDTVEANDENFKLRNGKWFVPKDFGVA